MIDIVAMSAERDKVVAQAEALVEEMASLDEDSVEFAANQELVEDLIKQRDGFDRELIKADKLNALNKTIHTAAPVTAPKDSPKGKTMSKHKVELDVEPGINAARALKAGLYAQLNQITQADAAERIYGSEFADVFRAAQATVPDSAGGALVPGEFSSEIVKILKNATVVRRAGAQTLPVTGGTLTISRGVSGPTATWVGENDKANATSVTLGDLVLTPKRLDATIPISNELLADAALDVDAYVRDELVREMAVAEDLAFLTGAATDAAKPTGLLYQGTSTATAGTSTANMETDIKGLLNRLESGMKGQLVNPVWIMNPQHFRALQFARAATTNEVAFPDLRESPGMGFFGYPVFKTTAIAASSGQMFLVDMNEVIIGQTMPLEVTVSREAAYYNASGTLTSAFSRNQTVIMVRLRVDLGVKRPEGVEVLTGVSYS